MTETAMRLAHGQGTTDAIERACEAVGNLRPFAKAKRRCIRAGAHAYVRNPETFRNAGLIVPDAWHMIHNLDMALIRRAIIRRVRTRLRSIRMLETMHPHLYRFGQEVLLWQILGGEMLAKGRHVKTVKEL